MKGIKGKEKLPASRVVGRGAFSGLFVGGVGLPPRPFGAGDCGVISGLSGLCLRGRGRPLSASDRPDKRKTARFTGGRLAVRYDGSFRLFQTEGTTSATVGIGFPRTEGMAAAGIGNGSARKRERRPIPSEPYHPDGEKNRPLCRRAVESLKEFLIFPSGGNGGSSHRKRIFPKGRTTAQPLKSDLSRKRERRNDGRYHRNQIFSTDSVTVSPLMFHSREWVSTWS